MPDIKELLKDYKNKQTVLYGLGTETERALATLEDYFNIAGLLDGYRESGELYGKPILSLLEVLDKSVELIIVVARPGSCRAITKRISSFCKDNNIALYDIRGKNLLSRKSVLHDFSHIQGGTICELFEKINRANVVSFDLFDTLVMRKVLSYTDIFEILDYRLKEKNIEIPDFTRLRLASEKELAKYGAPTLTEIYVYLLKQLAYEIDISAKMLAEMEWDIDYETLIPRQSVCDIYRKIVKQKKIVVVTDTYYRKGQIEKILKKCGVTDYSDIYVSCEYHTGKTQELWNIFKRLNGSEYYLHIGDDLTADVENPLRYGIDTFHIFSAYDLLEELGVLGNDSYILNFSDRVKIGLLVSKIFNNPFQFETKSIEIESAEEIGYLFCAPIISDFLFWFCDKVKENGIETILFSSRDGYLLKKLYEMMGKKKSVYFLTSRIAAIRAGMMDKSDIAYVDSMKFSGTTDENLLVRFGIHADKLSNSDDVSRNLMAYSDVILSHAKNQYKNYKLYIDCLSLQKGTVAFFDFVAKGTTQMYVQRLMNQHLKGLYFLQLELEFMKDKGLDIESFYSERIRDNSTLFDDYYILETILTAPDSQVLEFDESGRPVYAEETRSECDIRCICDMQEGVLDYFMDYITLVPVGLHNENKKLDEAILRLIHIFKIVNKDFCSLLIEDPFFNRMTPIMDML